MDAEIDKINNQLAEMLRGLELRKRAYYVNMPNLVYVIGRLEIFLNYFDGIRTMGIFVGGYLFDPIRKERQTPSNDWRWNIEEKKLEKIPSIPGQGRINFGVAANNGRWMNINFFTDLMKGLPFFFLL